jgi:hypothetical protein
MVDAPPVPEPDQKDWTWAIRERCPECGFDPGAVTHETLPELTGEYAGTIAQALAGRAAAARPNPAVWSALEYGCHVRDVCRVFGGRVELMLVEDDPLFANWDQDRTAIEGRYWEQQPAHVAGELKQAAEEIAATFATVAGGQWDRPGRRSNGSAFTVDTIGRYFLHDLAHHAWDVTGRQHGQAPR